MKKNIVFLLILIPIIWISCDGMGHQTIDFRKIENLMPQHPDSALMLLEQIENKENLSRKDKAHYYLLKKGLILMRCCTIGILCRRFMSLSITDTIRFLQLLR